MAYPVKRPSRFEQAGRGTVQPKRGRRALAQAFCERGFVEEDRIAQAQQHLMAAAVLDEALADQARVARETTSASGSGLTPACTQPTSSTRNAGS
jgi:hypothetical protein